VRRYRKKNIPTANSSLPKPRSCSFLGLLVHLSVHLVLAGTVVDSETEKSKVEHTRLTSCATKRKG
jgi:hypothetical protein